MGELFLLDWYLWLCDKMFGRVRNATLKRALNVFVAVGAIAVVGFTLWVMASMFHSH